MLGLVLAASQPAARFLPTAEVMAYTERSASINGTNVNVRSGPGTSNSVVTRLTKGAAVTVTGEASASDGALWYQVRFVNGGTEMTGYVSSAYIKFPVSYTSDADFEAYLTAQGFPDSYKDSLRALHAKYPNWVTCPWPEDYLEILDYQWNQVLIPYWKEASAYAQSHGVKKIAFEMHPGFCVYSPETLMKLRDAVGPIIGANFDPSHLIWQGVDPVAAIRYLGDAIYHFHAKDTKIDPINAARTGVLDTKHYSDEIHRSWIFRTVGYGHDAQWWRDVISNLRLVGYDGAISIEHEDSLMSVDEGLRKAVEFLKDTLIYEPLPKSISWA